MIRLVTFLVSLLEFQVFKIDQMSINSTMLFYINVWKCWKIIEELSSSNISFLQENIKDC